MPDFKILSLDGGSTWALIQVKALIDLYSTAGDGGDVTGHQILKKFDLIAANSGGTLTLGGLILDWPLSKLQDIFRSAAMRDQIFVKADFCDDPIAHITNIFGFGPKYSTKGKYAGLRSVLGAEADALVTAVPATIGKNYGDRLPQFVFCGFNYDTNRETFFRSDAASLAASFAPPLPVTVAQAIHASANPPINYFDAPADLPQHTRFWDGAVGGYNNPVLAAVIEAVANAARYNTSVPEIRALSIGTANVVLPPALGLVGEDPDLVAPRQSSTMLSDVKKLAASILDDPPDAATFHAYIMLGGLLPEPGGGDPPSGPIVRMNPLIQPDPGDGDVPWVFPVGLPRTDFVAIRDLPMDATDDDGVAKIENLANVWIADTVSNQPIRANTMTLRPEIGHGRYQLAKATALKYFA